MDFIQTGDLSMLAVETQGLTKIFRQRRGLFTKHLVTAVEDVSIKVNQGEMFGLLGPNGAGKTTLLKMLATLIVPTNGYARVHQFDLSKDNRIRPLIGFVSAEDRNFYGRLSGREHLEFFATLQNLSGYTTRKRIKELLTLVGLADQNKTWIQCYSTGMKRRLNIARALLHNPQVLILDEPAKDLDPFFGTQLMEWIKRDLVEQQGKTVLLSTHRLEEAGALCDRVAMMDCGRLRWCGTLNELRHSSKTELQAIYRSVIGGDIAHLTG